jgi:hypothetical protein
MKHTHWPRCVITCHCGTSAPCIKLSSNLTTALNNVTIGYIVSCQRSHLLYEPKGYNLSDNISLYVDRTHIRTCTTSCKAQHNHELPFCNARASILIASAISNPVGLGPLSLSHLSFMTAVKPFTASHNIVVASKPTTGVSGSSSRSLFTLRAFLGFLQPRSVLSSSMRPR